MNLGVYLYTLRLKGYLAYEYNPFRNYLTDVDLYEIITDVGKVLVPNGCAVNPKNGEILTEKDSNWVDKRGNIIDDAIEISTAINNEIDETTNTMLGKLFAKAGSLIDLDTDKLNFDLEHPVDITILPSYDGSVNLILNDDKNIPRIINSRFSAREKNTYEIVDRIGENDTNIYNSNTFDKDTSLYFQYEYNPKIQYMGFIRGILPVGLYCFYFTYCDADDNESDYIAESGLVPVFLGTDSDAHSIDGGIKNLQSDKGVKLKLTNLDKSYNYLKVYYVRYFADYLLNRVYECKKIYKRYPINSNTLYLQITGNEEAEDLDPNILNVSRFNPKSVLTQAQCKNMLFFGNIVKNSDNYRELTDCALRIIPYIDYNSTIDSIDKDYIGQAYYDSLNMYSKVGYFNDEYYRFGVVFIYLNGTLSNVYNTLGLELVEETEETEETLLNLNSILCTKPLYTINGAILTRNYIEVDDNGWVKNSYNGGSYLNARGVCKTPKSSFNETIISGIKFKIPENVKKFLKEDLGIRGLFFVRQKRIPNILAQCYLLPMDELLEAPVLEYTENGTAKLSTECFLTQPNKSSGINYNDEGLLVLNNYNERLYDYNSTASEKSISSTAYAGICPDFSLDLPYFNQIFNGAEFKLLKVYNSPLIKNNRFYNIGTINSSVISNLQTVKICTVTEDVPTVAIEDRTYRLEIGEAEEVFRFGYAEVDKGTYNIGGGSIDTVNKATNLVRGKYSPYLAIYSTSKLDTGCLYNIYRASSVNEQQEFQNRMDSSEPFYAISDRYNFDELGESLICYRGDCYVNQYTHRLNRNFNDPSLPNNDLIIDMETWKDNYDVENQEKWADISRADINAVQMGSWITFKVKSPYNYALRSNDHSYVSEEALMGSPRSFFPRSRLLWRGENKMPDSYLYNDAYRATLGYKCYFTLLDVNYIKDTFSNRIQYSAIAIQDSFKNNYRYSLSTYFRDYSLEYGSIQKLVGFEGYLLVVFEHAIGVAVINERVLAGGGDGEPVFINTQNVLPEELTIISDTYGTQWGESVIKTEAGYVYGVDTIAKKIWRVKGQLLEILSDFKVNKFLVDNISLGERELYPTIGLKNVKTHYNNNKKDIMFTFYDDVYKDEEKVWNLCYNELLGEFITFYSWIPSYSENIDTQFFTFNRNTSKLLSLLSKCNYNIPENTGVLLDSPILKKGSVLVNEELTSLDLTELHYIIPEKVKYTVRNLDGTTITDIDKNSTNHYNNLEIEDIEFELEKDHWGNWKYFGISGNKLYRKGNINDSNIANQKGVLILYITPKFLELEAIIGVDTVTNFRTEAIAVTTEDWLKDYATQDFYLHGQAGIFNITENTYPCHWYDEYHPFEFEFVVNDKIGLLKIFTDLVMISNKAEPESFHFEIEGDNYEFSSDKRTMYFRLEATKELYLNLGSNMLFDRYYTDVVTNPYTYELYYRGGEGYDYTSKIVDKIYPVKSHGLVRLVKSTIFPLYYNRIDTYNDIYHTYQLMTGTGKDYQNLSGSEVVWDRDSNQFNIITHIKNSPIDLVGRLRGNSRYKEGKWNIQIPSIIFNLKNETENDYLDSDWKNGLPPLVLNYVPNDIEKPNVSNKDLPNTYELGLVRQDRWTYRKEARIRDKWMKVRVRYSGKNLAVIHSLITLYNISYS